MKLNLANINELVEVEKQGFSTRLEGMKAGLSGRIEDNGHWTNS